MGKARQGEGRRNVLLWVFFRWWFTEGVARAFSAPLGFNLDLFLNTSFLVKNTYTYSNS
jgi:hypothetical protein